MGYTMVDPMAHSVGFVMPSCAVRVARWGMPRSMRWDDPWSTMGCPVVHHGVAHGPFRRGALHGLPHGTCHCEYSRAVPLQTVDGSMARAMAHPTINNVVYHDLERDGVSFVLGALLLAYPLACAIARGIVAGG